MVAGKAGFLFLDFWWRPHFLFLDTKKSKLGNCHRNDFLSGGLMFLLKSLDSGLYL